MLLRHGASDLARAEEASHANCAVVSTLAVAVA